MHQDLLRRFTHCLTKILSKKWHMRVSMACGNKYSLWKQVWYLKYKLRITNTVCSSDQFTGRTPTCKWWWRTRAPKFEMDLGQATWKHLYAPIGLDLLCPLICLPNTNMLNEYSRRPCQLQIALSFGPFLTLISVECAYGWPAMDTDDELSILCSILWIVHYAQNYAHLVITKRLLSLLVYKVCLLSNRCFPPCWCLWWNRWKW